jgi:hypothetical protein
LESAGVEFIDENGGGPGVRCHIKEGEGGSEAAKASGVRLRKADQT